MASKKIKDNHIIIGEIPSDNHPFLFYKIGIDKQLSEGFKHVHFTCNCTAFKFSGKGGVERRCKHTNYFSIHSIDILTMKVKNNVNIFDNRPIYEIVGYYLDPQNNFSNIFWDWIFTIKINPNSPTNTIEIFLTEITCPFIMCGHIIRGKFFSQEFQTCEKCSKRFMPE